MFKNKVRKKVVVRLMGGIGNQLFQYSAGKRLAEVNNAELVIDSITGFQKDYQYRRKLELDNFKTVARKASRIERFNVAFKVLRSLCKFLGKNSFFGFVGFLSERGKGFDRRVLEYRLCRRTYMEGYWQSYKYFEDIENIIRKEFTIIPPSDHLNNELVNDIRTSVSVAVHVRFFDALGSDRGNNISKEYYCKAIEKIEENVKGARYFVFSDRPIEAVELIPVDKERITVVSHNKGDSLAYADLWLMSQCNHFIIANSTFSWWGAWLSTQSESKIVVAPGLNKTEGVSSWGFEGLLPDEWIRC